jgi:mannose/fructose/N-acetylgalactosamine-specific phosphotransferase system component IID
MGGVAGIFIVLVTFFCLIFIEMITCFTAGHYRHGVRFIENRHEIDEKVVESSQIGDASM